MSPTVKPSEIQEVSARRVKLLRQLSFAEVSALPERQDEMEAIRTRKVAVAIYRDALPDGRIRIVVQVYFHRFLGIGTMTADGFIIAPDDTRTPVPQDMMWEFT
jgi:hypothetical protein